MIGIDVTKELEVNLGRITLCPIGIYLDICGLQELEKKTAAEAKTFHQSILRDMDRQKKRQEEQLKQVIIISV